MNETNQQLVDMMEHVWRSISGLCDSLTEAEWKTPTDCPGWSVQDQVSHLAGSETGILGDPAPRHSVSPDGLSHTRSEQGRNNEIVVDFRRLWTGEQVLSDFQAKTARRMEILRAMSDGDFAVEMQTPVGPGSVSEFLSIRIMDAWIHEQDIRRALNRPGHMDSPAAAHALNRVIRAMPFVAARRAQAPDGATVVFHISGPPGRVIAICVEGGRGRELDTAPNLGEYSPLPLRGRARVGVNPDGEQAPNHGEPPFGPGSGEPPTVRITLDAETFGCLGCGRWNPDVVLQSGKVKIEGDTALGQSIVRQMNIMP